MTMSHLCCRLCFCCAGLSKFAGGMLGAAFSPRLMLAVGLMATSVINITFGFTTGVFWWTALWAMNGGLQVRKQPWLQAPTRMLRYFLPMLFGRRSTNQFGRSCLHDCIWHAGEPTWLWADVY
jgi:hypothetical protein